MELIQNHIEAIIFCAPNAVSAQEIRQVIAEIYGADISEEELQNILKTLCEKYRDDRYPFSIVEMGGGFQFLTKPAYQASIGIYLKQKSKKRLSTSALETLAIIAYKQPITKSEIEQIRGVNCDYTLQKLLEKELIELKGKADTIGRPVLYGTSQKFMDYFGINKLSDLPALRDIQEAENIIGISEN